MTLQAHHSPRMDGQIYSKRRSRQAFLSLSLSLLVLIIGLSATHFTPAVGAPKKTTAGNNKAGAKTGKQNAGAGQDLKKNNETGSKNGTEAGKPKRGACISPGGRFPPFSLEGKPPVKLARGLKNDELPFCRLYKSKTCCGRAHAEMAFVSVRRMMLGGEGSEECLALWEALECAVCDPALGTQPGPPAICAAFCLRVYEACKDAFFSSDPHSQAVLPCGPRDNICARGTEWTSSGLELCQLAGFQVVNETAWGATGGQLDGSQDATSPPMKCFDGSPAAVGLDLGSRGGAAERSGRRQGSMEGVRRWVAGRWAEWTGGRQLGENVVWLVAGLVLTALGAFMRWRGHRGRRKRAALFAARSMQEARARQQAAMSASAPAGATSGKHQ